MNDKPRSFMLRGAHGLEPDQALLNVSIYTFPEYFRLMPLPSLAFHLHELLFSMVASSIEAGLIRSGFHFCRLPETGENDGQHRCDLRYGYR